MVKKKVPIVRRFQKIMLNPMGEALKKAPIRPKEEGKAPEMRKDVDISPQPESRIPAEFPKYDPLFYPSGAGGMSFAHGDKRLNLTAEEFSQFESMKGMMEGRRSASSQGKPVFPKVQELIDYENVQRALVSESREAIPKGISNQRELELYNKIKGKEQAGKEEEIRAIAAREAAKPVEPLGKAGSPEQAAGFIASGLLGSDVLSTAGATAGGAIAGGLIGGPPGALIGAGAGLLITAGKSLLARQGKNREADVLRAVGTSIASQKYLNFYKTEALNPLADKEDLISDYYDMKRQVYAAQAMIEDRSIIDRVFRVDDGVRELAKIKIWMDNEDNLDRDFFNNLAFADGDLYNSRIGQAVQAFNQEAK